MAVALVLSVLSVAAGALLATAPRVRAAGLGPIRTFSLAAAGVAVLGHLLPEAVASLGMLALFAFSFALALPWLLEKIGDAWIGLDRSHAHTHDHEHAHDQPHDDHGAKSGGSRFAIELSFATLLLHQVGDGVALHHYATGAEPSLDAALALSLHTVPVAAVVVLRFARPIHGDPKGARAWRPGLLRALWLAIATLAGIGLGATFASEWLREVAPWTAAIVAGFLLHVLAHDLGRDAPARTVDRVLELVALAAGIALAAGALILGADGDAHGAAHEVHDAHGGVWPDVLHVVGAMTDVAIVLAPWALAGLAITTALRVVMPDHDHRPAPERGIARVAWLLRRSLRSAGPTELAPTTVLTTMALLGWRVAIARVIGAVCVAIVLGVVGRGPGAVGPTRAAPAGDVRRDRVLRAFDGTLHANAPSLAFGIVLGGLVHGIVPDHPLDGSSLVEIGALAWMFVAIGVSSDGLLATPIAAAMTTRGMIPGIAAGMALLVSARRGTAFDDASSRPRPWGGAAALAAGIAVIFAIDQAWPTGAATALDVAAAHAPLGHAPAYVLAALLLVQLYRCGLRAWIASATGNRHHHPAHPSGS